MMKIKIKLHDRFLFFAMSAVLILGLACLIGCFPKKKINTDPYINRMSDDVLYQPTNGTNSNEKERYEQGPNEFTTEEITERSETLASNMAGSGDNVSTGALSSEMKALVDQDIYFEYDSSRLTPAAVEILRNKARGLRNSTNISVVIEGYTDSRGTTEYNLALGERRAESVKVFLSDAGVPSVRLTTISYGEENPMDSAENEEAWAINRRVHFIIKK
ncbi:OmpA family protein [Desulfococcaceae bacterium HSG9]|nr:OmpA family protein [Desulfococcaceae bacterium HSG9]